MFKPLAKILNIQSYENPNVILQEAQPSQRDRATAAWVSFGQNITVFNHCEVASQSIEFSEITQNEGYKAVQGHSRSPISVPIESPYATSYQ